MTNEFMVLTFKMIRGGKVKAMIAGFYQNRAEAEKVSKLLFNKQRRYFDTSVVKIW